MTTCVFVCVRGQVSQLATFDISSVEAAVRATAGSCDVSATVSSARAQVAELQRTFNDMSGRYMPDLRDARDVLKGLDEFFSLTLTGFVSRLAPAAMASALDTGGVSGLATYLLALADDVADAAGRVCGPPLCNTTLALDLVSEYGNSTAMAAAHVMDRRDFVGHGPLPLLYAIVRVAWPGGPGQVCTRMLSVRVSCVFAAWLCV